MTKRKRGIATTSIVLGALSAASTASAADVASSASSGLEEIVVTAQKRTENLQSVPIAVSVLTADQLGNMAIESSFGLTTAIPSLYVGHAAAWSATYIRGVGTNLYTPGSDPSVATYVDGVYSGNMASAMAGFNNIERVEVLKGPQGTLYGRNATGGLINIVTKTPTQDFQARASIGGGNYDRWEAKSYIAGGIAPNIAADLAVTYSNQGEGYFRNIVTGGTIGRDDGTYVRSKIVVDFSEAIRLVLAGSIADFNNTIGVPRNVAPGSNPVVPPGGIIPTTPGVYAVNPRELGNVKDYAGSANLSFDFNVARAVSITSYDYTTFRQINETDDSSFDLGYIATDARYKQFTQEFQLLSRSDSKVNWIAGIFYLWADDGLDPIQVYTRGAFVPSATNPASTVSGANSVSGFGQASIDVSDSGRLTVGARYTYDEKDYRRSYVPGVIARASWTKPTWRLAYDQKIGRDTLLYASYNRGYKAGAYNIAFGPPTAVNPETLDGFEVGSKSDLLNKRLRINTAAFFNLYNNMQVKSVAPDNITILTQNAAKSHIYGIDGDIDALLTDDLQLKIGFSWVHAKFVSYPKAVDYVRNPSGAPGNVQIAVDASGAQLPNTPELSGSITMSYNHEINGGGKLYGDASLFGSSSRAWDPGNFVRTGAYALLNGTIGYTLPNAHYSFELWGANLTNKSYVDVVTANAVPGNRYTWAPPRTYGARVKAEF